MSIGIDIITIRTLAVSSNFRYIPVTPQSSSFVHLHLEKHKKILYAVPSSTSYYSSFWAEKNMWWENMAAAISSEGKQ